MSHTRNQPFGFARMPLRTSSPNIGHSSCSKYLAPATSKANAIKPKKEADKSQERERERKISTTRERGGWRGKWRWRGNGRWRGKEREGKGGLEEGQEDVEAESNRKIQVRIDASICRDRLVVVICTYHRCTFIKKHVDR